MTDIHDPQSLPKNWHKIDRTWKVTPAFSNVPPDSTGTTYGITNISLGTDFRDRVGRVVRLRAVHVVIFMGDNLQTSPSAYRCTLLLDKHPNGSSPPYTDVFTAYGTPTFMNSIQYWKDRFLPLRDWFRAFGPTKTNFNTSPYCEYVEDWIDLDITTTYGSTVYPITNALIIALAGSNPASILNPDCTVFSEVFFTDE